MTDTFQIAIDRATVDDATLLSNLLELYIHDLSPFFPSVELGADGRFGYRNLPLYWSEPERRFPFLIRYNDRVAGFALVTRGSPASDDPNVYDLAEFFVVRPCRRSGVGRRAAALLWNRLPGKWTVRVSEGNTGAIPFWAGVIDEFSQGRAVATTRPGNPHAWRIYSFASSGA